MGYRSDVVIYIRHPEIHERFKELMGQKGNEDYAEELMRSESRITLSPPDIDPPWLLMHYQDIKWYDSYENVQRDNALYAEFQDKIHNDDSNGEYGCAFVRAGEEQGDVEYSNKGHGYDIAYPITSIQVDL